MKQINIGNDVRIKLSFVGDVVYNLENIKRVSGYFINTSCQDHCNCCFDRCGICRYHVLPCEKRHPERFVYKAPCDLLENNLGVYAYFPGQFQTVGKYDFILTTETEEDGWGAAGKRTYTEKYVDVLNIVCGDDQCIDVPDDPDEKCDCQLTQVVSSLPENNINKNTIYLVKSNNPEESDMFTEYVYLGDVDSDYDETQWEIIGKRSQDDVNLDDYLKKDDNATYENSGSMSAQDKKNLDKLLGEIYKFSIKSFSFSPSLAEVGSTVTVNISWSYSNEDQYPISSQSINDTVLPNQNRSYSTQETSDTHKQIPYRLSVTTQSGQTASSTQYITFNHRSYIGAIQSNKTSIDDADLQNLNSVLLPGKQISKKLAQDDQKLVYIYPTYFGELSSVKNSSGFEGLSGYVKNTITISGQPYYAYIQQIAATATDTYIFS